MTQEILRQGDGPRLQSPYEESWKVRVREGDVRMEAKVRVMPSEDGRRGHGMQEASRIATARKQILPQSEEPQKEPALLTARL